MHLKEGEKQNGTKLHEDEHGLHGQFFKGSNHEWK